MRKLAIVDKERIECKIEELRKEEEARYPFRPHLNENSRILAKKKEGRELTDDTERAERMMKKKKQAENWRMKECSFKPKINRKKKFKNIESNYSNKNYDKKINEYLEKKRLEVSHLELICLNRKTLL